ncbi:MAG: AGE family epimerase/isomerase [Rhodobacteraceae bacterium]|nr:AGE family epimerase/isomerase [Paracoccaceae bacterium]
MTAILPPGPANFPGFWLDTPEHRAWLAADADRQFRFFRASIRKPAGFFTLDYAGAPLRGDKQELHTTTRLIHSYALAQLRGVAGADAIVDHGMRYLRTHHRDTEYGGYVWALDGNGVIDGRKLAYGHVFVLLAGASALLAGHPDAPTLIDDVGGVLDRFFWEEEPGLLHDEWNRDWTPFSTYRGMNANMHGVEALLTAYEATGRELFLTRAGRILDFFVTRIAPAHGWRLPEHYTEEWQVDRTYAGDPMFRPAGTTPGHSFELGRLLLQYWDLNGRKGDSAPGNARRLIEQALSDGWNTERGGFAYTLDFDGRAANPSRYWWPVTEAIGALAALIKLDRRPADEVWYRRLWAFADRHLVDHAKGGWFPELDDAGSIASTQFVGKPDIYHSIQAVLFPLTPGLSRFGEALRQMP